MIDFKLKAPTTGPLLQSNRKLLSYYSDPALQTSVEATLIHIEKNSSFGRDLEQNNTRAQAVPIFLKFDILDQVEWLSLEPANF